MSAVVVTFDGRRLTNEFGRWNGTTDAPQPHRVIMPWPKEVYAMWCAQHATGGWHCSVTRNPKEWVYSFNRVEDAVHFALRWKGQV